MNKGRRNELTQLKYKKRLKLYNCKQWFALKSHGKPCSCSMCRGLKYRDVDRAKNKLTHRDLE